MVFADELMYPAGQQCVIEVFDVVFVMIVEGWTCHFDS